ncbi:YbcC family protein [Roseospira goensis]|uniref:Probable inorganic carbon transporter subunit DabA n=1 Tax=Roseospira goensis TaxID=391922 RepID=A0A7W6RZP9_9PROT|nr:DUF2309 domain-containing protein [Roseospira goensis]MBB4286191.1 hypothetical protein [Roseospira goensis]
MTHLSPLEATPSAASTRSAASRPSRPVDPAVLQAAAGAAAARVAPVWPLRTFVAVNPFLGHAEDPFAATAATLARTTGARLLMPRAWYRQALAEGRAEDADLTAALAAATGRPGTPPSVDALKVALARPAPEIAPTATTLAEVVDRVHGTDAATVVVEAVSRWAAGHWDAGQAAWAQPGRDRSPFAAWRLVAAHDRTPEIMLGRAGLRAAIAALPEDAQAAQGLAVSRLALPDAALGPYLHRALASIGGWAAYARQKGWQAELSGGTDDSLDHLLAVRLAWDLALWTVFTDPDTGRAWADALTAMAAPDDGAAAAALAPEAIVQDALDRAAQRRLGARLTTAAAAAPAAETATATRPAVQAAFCIDVRSEVYRRALEAAAPAVETIGFAGFFGVPLEVVPLGAQTGGAQCPVLLAPAATVGETTGAGQDAEAVRTRRDHGQVRKVWSTFKGAAVSCFVHVETAGLLFAGKVLGDATGATRPAPDDRTAGLDGAAARRLRPDLEPRSLGGRAIGLDIAARVEMAEGLLRGMSLTRTDGLARLLLLVGHGASTVNNPHRAGLDCGACGGHTGEANARVAARLLNDPAVRAGLAARGLALPDDTWAVAGLHDTTTDDVTLYDVADLPDSHADDLDRLRAWLRAAGQRARTERAPGLRVGAGVDRHAAVRARARDWAQVRPEWGLAGNAAFIAAPRDRTRDLDLGGRAFLHSYDWRQDEGFGVLELILTAPLVVASWINLQYYGSTVDNRAYGSGNKVLHNVVGTLGVLEGNGGDLRVGLPWQSLHDGHRLVHEPLRLSAWIEAPDDAIAAILARHDGVRALLDNGWVTLYALGDGGRRVRRYAGGLTWDTAWGPAAGASTAPAPTGTARGRSVGDPGRS